MNLKQITINYNQIKLNSRNAAKIRGYFGNKYVDDDLFHNHDNKSGKEKYRYPLIQYKVVEDSPMVLGIGEGVESLKGILFDENIVDINGETISLETAEVKTKNTEFGLSDSLIEYKFENIWYALNQKNHKRYLNSSKEEKKELLEKILIGNIISISKYLKYDVKDKIYCIGKFNETYFKLNDCKIKGFIGTFVVNFKLPDYIGLGKNVSKGLGTIKKI